MSNTSNSDLSTTIANMMEVINPQRNKRKSELRTPLDFISPLKRRLSAESTDTPEKRAKLDSSLDVSWIASPREQRRLRVELIEARSVIAGLESRIQHMHGIRKELQVMFDNEIKSFQQQQERDRKTIAELETQMQSIRKREKEAREELDLMKSKVGTDKIDYESKIEDLEITINKQNSELQVFKSEEQDEVSRLNNQIEELEMLVDAAREDAEAQKELASELESRLSKLTAVEREIEMKDQVLLKAQLKIKDLEYTLEGYGEWQAQSKIQQQKLTQFPELEREVQRLRGETKNLREQVRNKLILEEQVYDLQTRIETKGKVLHLKLNPLAVAVAENDITIEKLQAEVDRLRRKIKSLEEGLETTKLSDSVYSTREVQALREEVESYKIKMQRLKECFKSSSHEFRNACYMLFGFKIDRESNSQYTLSSMYAESPEDTLQFKYSEGNMSLLQNEFSASLEDMIELHLRHQGSLPVFLSALTMDLYNRTTVSA